MFGRPPCSVVFVYRSPTISRKGSHSMRVDISPNRSPRSFTRLYCSCNAKSTRDSIPFVRCSKIKYFRWGYSKFSMIFISSLPAVPDCLWFCVMMRFFLTFRRSAYIFLLPVRLYLPFRGEILKKIVWIHSLHQPDLLHQGHLVIEEHLLNDLPVLPMGYRAELYFELFPGGGG